MESWVISKKGMKVGKHRTINALMPGGNKLVLLKTITAIRKMEESVLKKAKVLTRRRMFLVALDSGEDWEEIGVT